MISEKAKQILSEGASDDGEQTVIFLEEGPLCYIFRLFRARDGAGDPEQQAIRWLGRARILCRSSRGDLSTRIVRSKNEERVMAAVSGSEIEAREWTKQTADGSRLGTARTAR